MQGEDQPGDKGQFEGGSESDDQMSEYDSEENSESEEESDKNVRLVESYIPPKMFSSEELESLEEEGLSQINEQEELGEGELELTRAPVVEMNNTTHE